MAKNLVMVQNKYIALTYNLNGYWLQPWGADPNTELKVLKLTKNYV